MLHPAVCDLSIGEHSVAVGGLRVERVLSTELFKELVGQTGLPAHTPMAEACHDRWTDLAKALGAVSDGSELLLVVGHDGGVGEPGEAVVALLAIGRGATSAEARRRCVEGARTLRTLLTTTLDYAELVVIDDEFVLRRVLALATRPRVTELERRLQQLTVSEGIICRRPLGFRPEGRGPADPEHPARGELQHLFPWAPSDDPWSRLLGALQDEPGPAAMVVHAVGFPQGPDAALEHARLLLRQAEELTAQYGSTESVTNTQARLLRDQALHRLAIMEGPLLAARVFVVTEEPTSPALLATAVCSLDDASIRIASGGGEPMFRGGFVATQRGTEAALEPLDDAPLQHLFGPREAAGVLRTPMPREDDLPGLRVSRARTATLTGVVGSDAPLGLNTHRGKTTEVAMHEDQRFRHTYVIGQTGTGKSTLLLNLVLHDIRRGRGVAVLDPHGSLVTDVLERYPKERADDLVLVDLTDTERPVGLNVLRIHERDTWKFRIQRDLVIDDIYSFIARSYNLSLAGGPVFETHFRAMLGLLLGTQPQDPNLVPNLMLFRMAYTNAALRRRLRDRVGDDDPVLQTAVEEFESTGGEGSIQNVASYVTSKLQRFVSDAALRNITCQTSLLDIPDIVESGKVLLVDLGKGRFGDMAAGLLASQLVSRIRQAVMGRGTSPTAQPFYLYADEFQMFADERFAELLAEARKFRLALTFAHQFVQQLPDDVMRAVIGNVGTLVTLRVGAIDAQILGPTYAPIFGDRDLGGLPNFRAYVRSFGALGQTPFSVTLHPPPAERDLAMAAHLRTLSRLRYGRSRAVVEAEIRTTLERFKNLPAR